MPMAPVTCRNCGARVLVRKSSWNQTSVQWNADASSRCAERSLYGRELFLACTALNDSIVAAVRHGDLPIVDETASAAV
ncbi:ferredoxin [Mycobacterium sp. 1245111.1]|uniref:ferredoxin n=1 Tax=Mycobacterium sp. 1245111.1 TaxID=1834073 RepID=UPI00080125C4|nr:ferredoxin [Mycobacterium sp. 1245111.1]OBK33059.1 ferredoxin [Mycobacterium sp. 1245111.1]